MADGAEGRRTAAVAGEPGRVADARRLHQHRPRLDGVAQQVERLGRHPGRAGTGVALEVVVGVAGQVHGDALAYDVARADDLGGPAGAEEVLRLDAARVRRQHGRAAGLLRAHEQHLAGVGVRRPRLVVEVVTVVPDRHQAEVLHRREHGGAGADHDAHRPAADRQERAVALRRAGVGRQHHVAALPQPLGERRVEPSDVAVVGHADERAAARGGGRDHGLGQDLGPVVAGQHRPDGAGRLARPPAPAGPPALRGSARGRSGRAAAVTGGAGSDVSFSTVACRGGTARRRTSDRMPAYRAATAPVSAATSGVSTRSGLTTRRSGWRRPVCSVVEARSITKPSTSCPANRTLTRTPGCASALIVSGTA